MDAGAIYVWAQNDETIIRYNYIHDYNGMCFNSGIYCDDGASNCKLYGNAIVNIPDGCCINSRKVKDWCDTLKNNSNNYMAYNIVDSTIVFSGYGEEERHCKKGANIVLCRSYNNQPIMKYENLESISEDYFEYNYSNKQGRLKLPKYHRYLTRRIGVR